MKKYKPSDFGLDQHLCLDPTVEFTQKYIKNSIVKRRTMKLKQLQNEDRQSFTRMKTIPLKVEKNLLMDSVPSTVFEMDEEEESDEETNQFLFQ